MRAGDCPGLWLPWVVIASGLALVGFIVLRGRIREAYRRWKPPGWRRLEDPVVWFISSVVVPIVVGVVFLTFGIGLLTSDRC